MVPDLLQTVGHIDTAGNVHVYDVTLKDVILFATPDPMADLLPQQVEAAIKAQAEQLAARAAAMGFCLAIDRVPLPRLAMGNHEAAVRVWPMRKDGRNG